MVQVHTVFEAAAWRNKVDGLQQGTPHTDRVSAVAEGRQVAVELQAAHTVHDVDGSVVEQRRYGSPVSRRWVDPVLYRS
jgi:Uncharacterized protein conserved in bacteria (DUF2188)